ncbi:hypothetical protein V8E52_006520 [Russula decolorans]
MSEGPAIGSPPAQQGDSSAAAPATKNTKPVSEDKGPFNVAVDIEWVPFLGIIAEKLSVQPSDLIITSL